MKLTHNSLSTLIAWSSSCLLFSGFSTFFSDSTRLLWMIWGGFGLTSAVGLDVVARVRERARNMQMARIAVDRFDREMQQAAEESETHAAIREAISRVLNGRKPSPEGNSSRRRQGRVSCDLQVEILLPPDCRRTAAGATTRARLGRVTNLSDLGFELTLTEPLPPQRVTLILPTPDRDRISILGDVLWHESTTDRMHLAGGRFLSVVSNRGA